MRLVAWHHHHYHLLVVSLSSPETAALLVTGEPLVTGMSLGLGALSAICAWGWRAAEVAAWYAAAQCWLGW